MKVCIKCKESKPSDEFSIKRAAKDGRNGSCKDCDRIAKQDYRDSNREKYRENSRLHREKNKEKINKQQNAGYQRHKEKRLASMKQHRLEKPEVELLKGAKYRAKKKGLPFNITLDDVRVPDLCPVLGISLYVGEGAVHKASPTLDRFIPELGYVQGNVYVISSLANTIKSNAAWSEVLAVSQWMQKITENNYESNVRPSTIA